ncbi:putative mitochondrial serine--tRNA ligase [Drechmeria coniospora]|uniref:serine--tRNA ligase n=1 Tax=Drechmeria coniospora TaxID=98403 RepID=A0A151GMP3_DRECN|nr:putative mitochondrial serine--tRNA ligase [Drechmeria coniospora]KYK58394.1 putative mitochondrial serine--tRNA ligase [Drechmeria coniospora]
MNKSQTCLRCRALRPVTKPVHATRRFTDVKRPPTAPKPVVDIKHIRQNPELYELTCLQRNYKRQAEHPARILALHSRWQELQRQGRSLRERSNLLRKFLANPATSSGDDDTVDLRDMTREQVQDEARTLKAELSGIEKGEVEAVAEMEALALEMPNLTSDETPTDEARVLSYINQPPSFEESPENTFWRSHVHIGSELEILDFAGAATASGWGWYYLVGEAAQLEQALVQYALAVATKHGWTQVSPPGMVYSHIGAACGFQPRDQNGEQQVYTIAQSPADAARGVPEMCLAGTSEIPLAGMKANATVDAEDLPMKRVAVSRCYRAEAGARGADTKGLYRVHEFTKVEMFAWTAPDEVEVEDVYQELLDIQTEILSSLGLYCRVLSMPATDLGASATRKVDIEAFFPSRQQHSDGWGEVTSASICTDYQTRRLLTRTRFQGKMVFPYTVNGTALAVPRVLAALLEGGWDEETGTVAIPECLRPWMDGKETIGRKRGVRATKSEPEQA